MRRIALGIIGLLIAAAGRAVEAQGFGVEFAAIMIGMSKGASAAKNRPRS
jgi:hypothetical protein